MWEAIQANSRRSKLLIGLMGSILAGLGALIGVVYAGGEGALAGAVAAIVVWLVMLAVALSNGEKVLLRGSRARKIKKEDAPQLWNVVEEMTIAAGLGGMPDIYVIDNDMPNAFAAGAKPEHACVAVTSGLLRRLNRDELQGVIAHEIAHIKNHDVRFLTIAAVMVGSVAIVSDVFLRSLWFGGGRKRTVKGGGQAQMVLILVAIAAAILAPICTQLLYYAVSRKREYLADASGARFTRYPQGLASALEKISGSMMPRAGVMRVLAPMYIVNPLQARGAVGWMATHPPTHKRVEILRSMGGNAGWMDYEAAFKKVMGPGARCLDTTTLGSEGSLPARQPTAEPETAQEKTVERAQQVHGLLDRLVNFLFLTCLCGVRIRMPSKLDVKSIRCPRCGRENAVPAAEAQAGDTAGDPEAPLVYHRKGEGWESFKCGCGSGLQISPAFKASSVSCRHCRRQIKIVGQHQAEVGGVSD